LGTETGVHTGNPIGKELLKDGKSRRTKPKKMPDLSQKVFGKRQSLRRKRRKREGQGDRGPSVLGRTKVVIGRASTASERKGGKQNTMSRDRTRQYRKPTTGRGFLKLR